MPPDDAHVVIRGGPVAAEKIVEHALRQAREYSLVGAPMWSVSVSLTMAGWSVDEILAGPMASRSTIATSTVGRAAEPVQASPEVIVTNSIEVDIPSDPLEILPGDPFESGRSNAPRSPAVGLNFAQGSHLPTARVGLCGDAGVEEATLYPAYTRSLGDVVDNGVSTVTATTPGEERG